MDSSRIKFFNIKSDPTDSRRWSGDGWEAGCQKNYMYDWYEAWLKIHNGFHVSVTGDEFWSAVNKLESALRHTNGCLNLIIHKTGLK